MPKKHKPDPRNWGDATKLVRGGTNRTQHGETSEALFLNSGFVYDEPETAERRFSGEDDGYVYGRMVPENAADILLGAEAYAKTTDGLVPWRERPVIFRKQSIARIPPMEP